MPRVDPATPADAPAIQRLAREAWHAAYDDILGAETVETVLKEWYDEAGLRDAIADPAHVFLRSRDDEAIRGFAHAGPHAEQDCWALYRLYVAPNRWGEGIGTALLERVEAEMRSRDVQRYELGVLAENDVGVAFYEARGLERVGTDRVALGGVETTEHTYRKALCVSGSPRSK